MRERGILAFAAIAGLLPVTAGAYQHVGARWHPEDIPVAWSATIPADVSGLPPDQVLDILRASFDAWEDDPGSVIAFTESDASARRPIEFDFSWSQGWGVISQTCLSSSSGASTRCGTSTVGRLTRAEIKINRTNSWMTRAQMRSGSCRVSSELDGWLEWHVGRAIGIWGSDVAPAVMAPPRFACFLHSLPLQLDDIAAVRALYCPDSALFGVTLAGMDDAIEPACSDGDGSADGGERVRFDLRLTTFGFDAAGVRVRAASSLGWLHVERDAIDVGTLPAGASEDVAIEAEVDTYAPPGIEEELIVVVEDGAGAAQAFRFPLVLQRDPYLRHVRFVDEALEEPNWHGNGWVRVTDPCMLPDAVDPWRTARSGDCRSRSDGGYLWGTLSLPEAPGTHPLTVTLRHSLECAEPADFARLYVGVTNPDWMYVAHLEGAMPWQDGQWVVRRDHGTEIPVMLKYVSGGGSAMGWSFDSIAVEWDVPEFPTQSVPTCVRPCAIVADAGPGVVTCRGQDVVLSAAGSRVEHCDGAVRYRWRRGTVVLGESVDPSWRVVDPQPGEHSVEVICETRPGCTATAAVDVVVEDVPEPVGPTLRVGKDASAVLLEWTSPAGSMSADVKRLPLAEVGGDPPLVAVVASGSRHADTEARGRGSFAFVVEAVNACGSE